MKRLMTTTALSVALIVPTTSQALGSDEETVLKFLGGVYVIEKIVDYSKKNERRYERPLTSEEERAYREGVAARERQEAAERKRRAYECGYSGNC